MRKNVCYDNYYDFPFDAAIPKFTAHLWKYLLNVTEEEPY